MHHLLADHALAVGPLERNGTGDHDVLRGGTVHGGLSGGLERAGGVIREMFVLEDVCIDGGYKLVVHNVGVKWGLRAVIGVLRNRVKRGRDVHWYHTP